MIFTPGTYYVGDPGFVLPNDDLRALFIQSLNGVQTGLKDFITSYKSLQSISCSKYWVAGMPNRKGTLYDQQGNGWGFNFGCFGVVPWVLLEFDGNYDSHKIEFTKPFECSATEDSITIGYLHFTFNPK